MEGWVPNFASVTARPTWGRDPPDWYRQNDSAQIIEFNLDGIASFNITQGEYRLLADWISQNKLRADNPAHQPYIVAFLNYLKGMNVMNVPQGSVPAGFNPIYKEGQGSQQPVYDLSKNGGFPQNSSGNYFPQQNTPIPQLFPQQQTIPVQPPFPQQQRFQEANFQPAPPPPPEYQVTFVFKNVPLSSTGYYHDVVLSGEYIILVFDEGAGGYPKTFPQGGAQMRLSCEKLLLNADNVFATGLEFRHRNFSYCVLVQMESPPDRPQQPSLEDTGASESSKE